MSRTFKRVVAIADLHCGHYVGLTPPQFQVSAADFDDDDTRRIAEHWQKIERIQDAMWRKYMALVKKLRPVDCLLVVGDCIDGKGYKSGGSEQSTSDRDTQAEMASMCIRRWKAEKIVIARGTPYHVGTLESWENEVADRVGADKIGGHEWVDVNGVIFDIKHKVGASSIPHGRHTAIAKQRLWNLLWAEKGIYPKADVLLRGHVHYENYCGGPGWHAMTLPALQGPGSKFGIEQCDGVVDWGVVSFDVYPDGRYSWEDHSVEVVAKPVEPLIV